MNTVSSLYIHFPFCLARCNYCDFFSSSPSCEDVEKQFGCYEEFLEQSWSEKHQKLLQDEDVQIDPLATVYLGGGTPSLWGARGARFVKDFFDRHQLCLASESEFTLEANPGTLREGEALDVWKSIGVNRVSLGAQSLNETLLAHLGRKHDVHEALDAIKTIKEKDFNLSVDLMLGLPFSENKRDVLAELDQLLSLGVDHISVYILTVKESYIHQHALPSEEWTCREFLEVASYLESHGFIHYEVSNFARKNKFSKHNLKYWQYESVMALGKSGTGLLVKSKEKALRYKWKSVDVNGPEFEKEMLDEEACKLERLYMNLRSFIGVSFDQMPMIEKVLSRWQESGYIKQMHPRVTLTSLGYLMLDSLMDDLFRLN